MVTRNEEVWRGMRVSLCRGKGPTQNPYRRHSYNVHSLREHTETYPHSNSVRNFNSLSILYVVQYTATAGRIFNPPKLRCCDGFPIRYHPIGKLLVDSFLGGPHGTPVVYPDDGSAPLARGFSI